MRIFSVASHRIVCFITDVAGFTGKKCHRACPTRGQTSWVLLATLSCLQKRRLSPPCINLRPLNEYIRVRPFKMETLRSVICFVKLGNWLASIDLKDAYLHIPICPSHHKYLRFAFQGDCYQFGVLQFGLNTASMVWTKVLAPIMEILHL